MSTDKLADVIYGAPSGSTLISPVRSANRVREAFVVIDRNDLPSVKEHLDGSRYAEHKDANGSWWGGATPEFLHGRVLELLALAEHLRKSPPVDEEAVRELTAFLDNEGLSVPNDGLARRMVKAGWKREVTS